LIELESFHGGPHEGYEEGVVDKDPYCHAHTLKINKSLVTAAIDLRTLHIFLKDIFTSPRWK
jgi:hypothetical protein